MKKLAGTLCLAFSAVAFMRGDAAAQQVHNLPPQADAVYLIDANRNQVLEDSQADELRYPASLVKLMTLILLFEALDAGQLSLDDEMTVSRQASQVRNNGVRLGLKPGDKIKVRDAIPALTVKSFNDVAQVVAEALAGSEDAFADLMNRRAKDLGLTKTYFTNATGLPDKRQVTTAHDMASLCLHLIDNLAHHYQYFSLTSFTYGGTTYPTHNRLMTRYPGMDGIKTGYIAASGFNLAASAERNGERIIGIVFGHPSAADRDNKMADLLDKAFDELKIRGKAALQQLSDILVPRVVAPASIQPVNNSPIYIPPALLRRNDF